LRSLHRLPRIAPDLKDDALVALKGPGLVFAVSIRNVVLVAALAAAVTGCQRNPLIVKRSPCPAVAVPTYLGDITLFTAGGTADARNIDMIATLTNVRETCLENADKLTTDIRYDVLARRTEAGPARTLTLPVFATIVQGGNLVVSKQMAPVTITFAEGQTRAMVSGGVRTNIARSAASLPAEIQAKVTRKRRPTDADAAVDPMADPQVKAALRAASFEVLVGFQLDDAGLAYNVTK
jgi:hypothetical protein